MAGELVRTTISIDQMIYLAGEKRRKSFDPPYKNFSQYVEALIQRDAKEGGPHITTREDKTRVMRADPWPPRKKTTYGGKKQKN